MAFSVLSSHRVALPFGRDETKPAVASFLRPEVAVVGAMRSLRATALPLNGTPTPRSSAKIRCSFSLSSASKEGEIGVVAILYLTSAWQEELDMNATTMDVQF